MVRTNRHQEAGGLGAERPLVRTQSPRFPNHPHRSAEPRNWHRVVVDDEYADHRTWTPVSRFCQSGRGSAYEIGPKGPFGFGPIPAEMAGNQPKSGAVDTGPHAQKPVNKPNSGLGVAWIAPRRSPVRVRLAPSKFLQRGELLPVY
jgi:hypothetical protein